MTPRLAWASQTSRELIWLAGRTCSTTRPSADGDGLLRALPSAVVAAFWLVWPLTTTTGPCSGSAGSVCTTNQRDRPRGRTTAGAGAVSPAAGTRHPATRPAPGRVARCSYGSTAPARPTRVLDWLTAQGLSYSVGFGLPANTEKLLALLPKGVWQVAYDSDGSVQDGAWVAELIGVMDLTGATTGRLRSLWATLSSPGWVTSPKVEKHMPAPGSSPLGSKPR